MRIDKHLEFGSSPWPSPARPADSSIEPSPLREVLEEEFGEDVFVWPVITGYKAHFASTGREDRSVELVEGDLPTNMTVPLSEQAYYDFHGYPNTPGTVDYFDFGDAL